MPSKEAGSLAEPRSIIQSMISKFSSESEVEAIRKIEQAHAAMQRSRAEQLAASRETLQCTKSLKFLDV